MKSNQKVRALSVLLAVLMLASAAVSVIPISAAEPLGAGVPEILWSANFDDAYATSGSATQAKLASPTNGDDKLPLSAKSGDPTVTAISAQLLHSNRLKFGGGALFSDYDPSKTEDYNLFFDLMYGRTEHTSYYMEMDFTPTALDSATNPTHLYASSSSVNTIVDISNMSDDDIATSYNFDSNGDGVDDTFVNYTVNSLRRGPSYFCILQGGYNELFKISPKGYVYGPGGTSGGVSLTGNADGATNTVNNWNDFTYNYLVAEKGSDGKWTWVAKESNKTLTADVVNAMREIKGEDFTLSWGNALVNYNKAYKIEPFRNYKIRIEFSVNKDAKNVTYTTYIRENVGDTPWFKVAERTLATLFGTSGKRGTDYPSAVRIVENHATKAYVDNWFFATFPEDCSNGHITPVIQTEYALEGYRGVYNVKCKACGQIYYVYDEAKEDETRYVFNSDFTTMTQAQFDAFNSKFKLVNGVFEQGTGVVAKELGVWLSHFNGATGEGTVEINGKKPYEVSFTANFSSFAATEGTSFFTDTTDGWNWLLRYGTTNIDGTLTEASVNKPWVKMKGPNGSTAVNKASDTPYVTYLEKGKDYTFTLKFDGSYYDVYISENGGTPMHLGRGKHGNSGINNRAYRICDNRGGLNYVVKDWYVKADFETPYDVQTYDIFDETMVGWTNTFNSNTVPLANEYGFFVGNKPYDAINSYLNDTNLVLKDGPANISFDFMLTDAGAVNPSPSQTGNQYWSLITWQTRTDKPSDYYGAILSVGALDNNGDGVFDKHFLTMGVDASPDSGAPYVSEDKATAEEKKNQSVVVGETTYYYTDRSSIYDLTVGEWVNISLTLDAAQNVVNVYVNGEHVASKYNNDAITSFPGLNGYELTKSQIRFGDGFNRRFCYTYAIKDVELTTGGGYLNNNAGTLFYYNDFGSADRMMTKNWASDKLASINTLCTIDPTIGTTTYSQVLDTETQQGYTRFTVPVANLGAGNSKLFDLSKSDKSAFTGEYTDMLVADGNKYSLKLNFAIPDRALTADEIAALRAQKSSGNLIWAGLTDTATTVDVIAKSNSSIIRLSKWHDNNQVRLLFLNVNGLYNNALNETGTWYFCDKDGNIYNPITKLDETGRPLKMTSVEAIIDEWNNTYTLYIDGNLAYRKNGVASTTVIPAVDMPMKVQFGNTSLTHTTVYGSGKTYEAYADVYKDAPEYKAWEASGKAFAMVPHHLTVTPAGSTETVQLGYPEDTWKNTSYIRFFQATYDAVVESLEINKIRDSKIEYIGSQMKEGELPETFDLRFVFGVDDVYVNNVFYRVSAEINAEGKGLDVDSEYDNKVYSSIVADGKTINAYEYFEGNYFSVLKVSGVEKADADTLYTFTITPYTVNGKGESVPTGEAYDVQFNGLGEYIGFAVVTE